jgi:hypothetical protein
MFLLTIFFASKWISISFYTLVSMSELPSIVCSDSNLKSQACSQSKMVQINIRVKYLIIFLSCRIVGQNPDRSLKSFPPCYSQSPLQHCLVISISSYPCNLLHFSSNSRNLLHISTINLHHTVKGKVWKLDRKPYPLPYVLRNLYRTLKVHKHEII